MIGWRLPCKKPKFSELTPQEQLSKADLDKQYRRKLVILYLNFAAFLPAQIFMQIKVFQDEVSSEDPELKNLPIFSWTFTCF